MLNFLSGALFTIAIALIVSILTSGYASIAIGATLVLCGAAISVSILFLRSTLIEDQN